MPQWAYHLSFVILAMFIVTVIMITTQEYQKEHAKVVNYHDKWLQQVAKDSMTTLYNQSFLETELKVCIDICNKKFGAVHSYVGY